MKFVIKDIKANYAFIIPYTLFLITGLVLISLHSKAELHIILNQFCCDFADVFFKYYTHAGDGLLISLVAVALLFVRFKYGIGLAASGISVLLVVQGLKRLVFNDIYRPQYFFENIYAGNYRLNVPEGVTLANMYSFPSGHTTTAFALFFFLCLITKAPKLKFLMFLLALLAGYSRVYLSFHFTEDILAGSVLGILLAYFGYWISTKLDAANWANKSLLTLKKAS
jgi:membrane-associated phospholipid phosphatase